MPAIPSARAINEITTASVSILSGTRESNQIKLTKRKKKTIDRCH